MRSSVRKYFFATLMLMMVCSLSSASQNTVPIRIGVIEGASAGIGRVRAVWNGTRMSVGVRQIGAAIYFMRCSASVIQNRVKTIFIFACI